jgi:hypothetical protein
MRSPARYSLILFLVHGLFTLSQATPLLFVNYSSQPTDFARARAGQLAISNSVTTDVGLEDLQGKSVVIMPGFSSYDSLLHDMPVLSSFVQNGGYLWINLAGSGCPSDAAPGGVDFVQWSCGSTYHNAETIADPDHAYFTGDFHTSAHSLTDSDFVTWDSTDAGHIAQLPANATTLLSNSRGPSLAEYSFGKGWVVVSTLTYGWGSGGARTAAMDNMLLYAAGQVRGSADVPSPVPESNTWLMLATGTVLGVVTRMAKQS